MKKVAQYKNQVHFIFAFNCKITLFLEIISVMSCLMYFTEFIETYLCQHTNTAEYVFIIFN